MTNFQQGILQDRAKDMIVRLCLAGRGRWSELFNGMADAGFIPRDKGGWPLRNIVQPMLDSGEIVRPFRGQYIATCPHCHEPILNVAGMEH